MSGRFQVRAPGKADYQSYLEWSGGSLGDAKQ